MLRAEMADGPHNTVATYKVRHRSICRGCDSCGCPELRLLRFRQQSLTPALFMNRLISKLRSVALVPLVVLAMLGLFKPKKDLEP